MISILVAFSLHVYTNTTLKQSSFRVCRLLLYFIIIATGFMYTIGILNNAHFSSYIKNTFVDYYQMDISDKTGLARNLRKKNIL